MPTNQGLLIASILIAAYTVYLFIAFPIVGWATSFVSAYLIALGGITASLYALPGAQLHYGIAPSALNFSLADVLLVSAVIAIWAEGGRLEIKWILATLTLPALALTIAVWGNAPEQWSGLKLYATAIISFGIGRWLSRNLTERRGFVLVVACLVICGVQFIVTFAQSRGINLLSFSGANTAQWLNENRMVGIYGHPGTAGKVMFLLLCILLPLSSSSHGATRKLAYIAIALGSFTTLLTLSRANAFAIGVAIILWLILSGRAAATATKVGIVAIAVSLVALNTSTISALQMRQSEDPYGGFRDEIFEIGKHQIQSAPLTGTGPNYYSEVVGQYDNFAATGFPLHNSFLYPVAELGIPLAVVFFLPIMIAVGSLVQRMLKQRQFHVMGAALLAVIPGVAAIAWTGWGMLATEVLPLWFLGFGFLTAQSVRGNAAVISDTEHQDPRRPLHNSNIP